MATKKSASEKLAALQAQMSELAKKAKVIKAQQSRAARAIDTKRKILLGAWLIAKHPDAVEKAVAQLRRPQDRALFEGWTAPSRNPEQKKPE